MPDINKFRELREMGYAIFPCCGLCEHGQFPNPATPWGTCALHGYQHLKHTGDRRGVSILRYGTCRGVTLQDPEVTLGAHVEFLSSK